MAHGDYWKGKWFNADTGEWEDKGKQMTKKPSKYNVFGEGASEHSDNWQDWLEEEKVNKGGAETDPFEVIGKIPEGKAYQWVAISIDGSVTLAKSDYQKMINGGWKPVPAKRHPKMPKEGGKIVVQGQVLMERDAFHNEAAKLRESEKARELLKEATPAQTNPDGAPQIAAFDPAEWLEKISKLRENLKKTEKNEAYIEMTIGVAVSVNELENAIMLNLTPTEYMRRRVIMDTQWLMRADMGNATECWKDVVPVFARGEVTIHREGVPR